MDLRARMKVKGPLMVKNGRDFNDNLSLLRDYISEEELWACTTCNACAKECPININHPTFIVDMRRYLVMEEASAPGELKAVFNNIENNGAPVAILCRGQDELGKRSGNKYKLTRMFICQLILKHFNTK